MPKPDKPNGGGNGGGGGGGDPVVDLTLVGTNGDDRLNGGDGNDTFHGLLGDDVFKGGAGFDTAVFSGSILDYSFAAGRRGSWIVSGPDGRDTAYGIEALQFDDYTYYTTGENDLHVDIETGTTDPYTPITIMATVADFDDDHVHLRATGGGPGAAIVDTYQIGDGLLRTYAITYYPINGNYIGLAEGEATSITLSFEAGSFEQGFTEVSAEITVIGVNDAPRIASTQDKLVVYEDGGPGALDLAPYGSDPDSDDDGTTLSYVIVDQPDGLGAYIDGTSLVYDPGDLYQRLNEGQHEEFRVHVQAVDSHGAVSNTFYFDIRVEGQDDPLPDYLNDDGSIDYAALGVDPGAVPLDGPLSGFENDLRNLEIVGSFTDGDDTLVINGSVFEYFADHTWLYQYLGLPWSDMTLDGGGGMNTIVFHLTGETTGIQSSDIVLGDAESVLVIDQTATGNAGVQFLDVLGSQYNDQILIDIEAGGGIGFNASGFSLGDGNDLMQVTLTADGAGTANGWVNATGSNDYDLGVGNDTLIIDLNIQNAASTSFGDSIEMGSGNDYLRLDNLDSTYADSYPYDNASGFEGDISLGDGDDVLDFYMVAQDGEGASATIGGRYGHDVVNLWGSSADWTIEELYPGYYRVTSSGQELIITGVEEINVSDGSLLDYLV